MDDASNQGGDSLPLDALERIEEACRRFEAAWRRGEEPAVEDAPGEANGPERAALLREIILLDLDYRCRRGEMPGAADYMRRLPADRAAVEAVFALPEAARPSAGSAAPGGGGPPDDDPKRLLGTTIGSSRLLHVIGRGGAGDVYAAVESSAVHGLVALKVVAPGGDHEAVLRCFEEERGRLAQGAHPSIVRLVSSGSTPGGLAYFASEHVPGEPITRYSDRHRLSIRDRLDLFLMAAGAVEHAHEKGLVHGSLKPSNVLVLLDAGRPLPRVTDLGIAGATRGRARDRAASAKPGQVPGHPEYTSPEEAEKGDSGIDVRTDVYSLGLILYEILTGKLPFRRRELRRSGYAGILRTIRESEAPEPSARLGASRESLERAAALRRVRPSALLRELRGDLDWVAMKAIDRDRERRYPTVSDLAADVERYLRSEPVAARPPGLAYRARKLARRLASRWRGR
jgi:hypothetical protein